VDIEPTNDMNTTEKQFKALSWHLWQAEAKWSPEIDQQLKDLDIGTASDVIGMFIDNHNDIALNQLRHLGINV